MSTHSKYSPSSRHRWSRCPGSIRLIEAVNPPEEVSDAMSEGIVAHALAADCLENGRDCTDPAVQFYLDYARALPGVMMVEQQLVHPEYSELHGTPDLLVFDFGGQLSVVDYKHGEGVGVAVEDNEQLQYYAALAAQVHGQPDEVLLAIVQPRYDGEPVKEDRQPGYMAEIWMNQILDEIEACEKPNAPLMAGPTQCRFCPVKAHCPELSASTQLAVGLRATMPSPERLRPDQLQWLLEHEKEITGYLKAVYAYALNNPPPGWKTVQGLGNRRWVDEKAVLKQLRAQKLRLDVVAPRTLLSPAQMEKTVGKDFVEPLVERPLGSWRLVPDTDPRPAVSAIDVFEEEA